MHSPEASPSSCCRLCKSGTDMKTLVGCGIHHYAHIYMLHNTCIDISVMKSKTTNWCELNQRRKEKKKKEKEKKHSLRSHFQNLFILKFYWLLFLHNKPFNKLNRTSIDFKMYVQSNPHTYLCILLFSLFYISSIFFTLFGFLMQIRGLSFKCATGSASCLFVDWYHSDRISRLAPNTSSIKLTTKMATYWGLYSLSSICNL